MKERLQYPIHGGERMSLFRRLLLSWFDQYGRILPWRGITDPYRIWVSEIILQQTQVVQGWDYYMRFIEAYPDVSALANARDEDVLLLWEGLGYYSRAHNMLVAARQVVEQHGCIFPQTEEEVSALKGIGPYTTAAIMSIAYNQPLAVVDGNVYRVLSRVEASEEPIDTTQGQKYYRLLASDYLDHSQPGKYNQAMMDLGAMICTPRSPKCHECPIAPLCKSRENKALIELLPIKAKKLVVDNRYLDYFLLIDGDCFWVERRDNKGIWKGLYQLPLVENTERALGENEIREKIRGSWALEKSIDLQPHRLTHRLLHIRIHLCYALTETHLPSSFKKIKLSEHPTLAFPKPLRHFLDQYF
ncbi:MAG: A/G-specific adenine glycosylase [Bacteroidales bacterium]|uniref:A/G-specific adenine glycosylase n=1 Tax=Porphyromonas sp. TaxID=1924944 RepID=UPI00297AB727|nr:A/G-specific adenine glycosylase [Porphyromonas sp.]MDD7437377.1 A/G-specific adenine glycosylase [Bacteroidales bacterium]MDY3066445.1 A/G-specific adenine glycosylase [Porphyromonas sp.]